MSPAAVSQAQRTGNDGHLPRKFLSLTHLWPCCLVSFQEVYLAPSLSEIVNPAECVTA